MAARLNPRHQQMVRDKIKASQLINRLQDYVLGTKVRGAAIELSAQQVSAAVALLKKCVPDLSATTISNDPETGPLRVIVEGIKAAHAADQGTVP